MRHPVNPFFVAVFLVVYLLGKVTVSRADDILIAAAASLSDVLQDLGKIYQAYSRDKVQLTLGPSNYLARQIDQGAPADIFFSADAAQMDFLEKNRRLEPGTRRNLLSNQLVLIVPGDSHLKLAAPKDLLKSTVVRIALADPNAVPVGVYTREYLTGEGLWESVKAKVVPVLDVRATLASVEAANADAGFVYRTDAAVSQKVKIAFAVPLDKGPKITYPIAVIRESKKKVAAEGFLKFASAHAAKTAFKKYGFVVLDSN